VTRRPSLYLIGRMESRSQLFGSALQFFWRLGVGFVFFCAASSVFMAGVGWLQIPFPAWTAGLAGLFVALFFDRVSRKAFDARSLEAWNGVPAWQFWSVAAVYIAVVGVASYFMLTTSSLDPLCHHGITNGILAFGSPVRDLGSFDRFLPYHALGNSLAAILASAIESLGGPRAVEASLDVVSLVSLAVFLGVASVLFILLLGVFPSSRQPGPLWLCFVFPLLVFGAGPVALAHLMPVVLDSAYCYPEFGAVTFHPLIQYLGRRSAVSAFTIFVVFLSALLLSSDRRFGSKWIPFLIISGCFVGLSYSSLDMFVAACVLLLTGLLLRDPRPKALLGLASLAVALPLIAVMGGAFTALLFNAPLPEAMSFFAWELREPTLVGFFKPPNLGGIPLSDPLALKVLAVDFPWFALSLPLALACIAKRTRCVPCLWVKILIGISLVMFAVPFFVFFAFSPWDLHRLFFWPLLFAGILTPFVLAGLVSSRAVRLWLGGAVLVVSCSSAIPKIALSAPDEIVTLLARQADDFRTSLGFDPQKDHTWIASVGWQNLLFINGCRVLALPFGTSGPVYYHFQPLLFDVLVQRRLRMANTDGATMALLDYDDFEFLRLHREGGMQVLMRFTLRIRGQNEEVFVVRLENSLPSR
jgi:hypothetical protein